MLPGCKRLPCGIHFFVQLASLGSMQLQLILMSFRDLQNSAWLIKQLGIFFFWTKNQKNMTSLRWFICIYLAIYGPENNGSLGVEEKNESCLRCRKNKLWWFGECATTKAWHFIGHLQWTWPVNSLMYWTRLKIYQFSAGICAYYSTLPTTGQRAWAIWTLIGNSKGMVFTLIILHIKISTTTGHGRSDSDLSG